MWNWLIMILPNGMSSSNVAFSSSSSLCLCGSDKSSTVLRLEHHLDAVILFVYEHVEAVRRLVQRECVGDDEARIDLAALDPLQQRAHIAMHMALAGLDRQRAVHH